MFFAPLVTFGLMVQLFLSQLTQVEGVSMLPNLRNQELFLTDRMSYLLENPQRGDVVVFRLPAQELDGGPQKIYVKRVIGLPGDYIHLKSDGVYLINQQSGLETKINEPYLFPQPVLAEKYLSMSNELGEKFFVPRGQYFVLGDNRLHSRDSRYFVKPFLTKDQIIGRYFFALTRPVAKVTVSVQPQNGAYHLFQAELAVGDFERELGLMNRIFLGPNEAMLFLFDRSQQLTFWMKNTLIPLDIIFIDEQFRVVHIAKSAQPCKADPCPLYHSEIPAKYVLEIAGGRAEELRIDVGATIYLKTE